MVKHEAVTIAAQLVQAALEAGWLKAETRGESLAQEVGNAIEGIANRIKAAAE